VKPDVQALFCRRRHQPRRPPLAKIRPGLGNTITVPKSKSVLTIEGQHALCKLVNYGDSSDDELTTASRQGEKSTASQDEAGQSCTGDGGRDGHAVEDKGRVKCWRSVTANDVGANP
jgi:hypothetical protein